MARLKAMSAAGHRTLLDALYRRSRGLVEWLNLAVGYEAFYFTDCVGIWRLYCCLPADERSSVEPPDRLILQGFLSIDDLGGLVCRLQDELAELAAK